MRQNHGTTEIIRERGDGTPGIIYRDGWQLTHIVKAEELMLILYDAAYREVVRIDMKPFHISGAVYSVRTNFDLSQGFYRFYADGALHEDGYEQGMTGIEAWGERSLLKTAVVPEPYYYAATERAKGEFPHLPMTDVVAYALHVRGFTMDASSRVKHPGTFAGVAEKANYFKELGVNQLILMPAYEFDEVDVRTGRLNYWGFGAARFFMPKTAYAAGHAQTEFPKLIETMHAAGIEVVMQFCFPQDAGAYFIGECLAFWHRVYRVDGFYLIGGNAATEYLSTMPALTDAKLYFESAEARSPEEEIVNRNVAVISRDYIKAIRRYLKGDADLLQEFSYQTRNRPAPLYALNYISNFNEFSLRDMVSYDFKHNEENGEFGRDGNNENFSWNCGIEGETRKQAVLKLRKKQMCNAMAMLLLSQGLPMLLAGDEWGQTRKGNNNPYCQDNEISWLNWRKDRTGTLLQSFVRQLIAFRMQHPMLHARDGLRMMDYKACSYPDLSYHGENAWYPNFENNVRHIGMLYCGKYARSAKMKEDAFLYIAYNMHWEEKTFGLPNLPKGKRWICAFDTENLCASKAEPYEGSFRLSGRSVCVLISEQTGEREPISL